MNTPRSSASAWLLRSLVIVLVLVVVLSLWNLAAATDFGESDFMIYWSAAYLIRNGENPYNLELIRAVQQAQSHSKPEVTTIAWNPPFLFLFLLPFAWLPFGVAKFAWLITCILIVITAALMLIEIYLAEASPRTRLAFLALALMFPAVITGLYMGQVTFLVFWGLVASLYLIGKGRWFWAGAVLILTTIKPHIIVLPVLYLLISMARQRKHEAWIGLIAAGLVGLAVLLILSPDLIKNPIGETAVASGRWATSTVGGILGFLGITEAARYLIVLFLPLPLYLAARMEQYDMRLSAALLVLVTVPFTFYGWSYDQTILLIPIAMLISWLPRSRHRLAIVLGMGSALILNYYQRGLPFNEVYYVWVPLFWGILFLVTWRSTSLPEKSLP